VPRPSVDVTVDNLALSQMGRTIMQMPAHRRGPLANTVSCETILSSSNNLDAGRRHE
jgi:hypothetical protein